MNYLIICYTCFFLSILGLVWIYCVNPRTPSMNYIVRKNKRDFFINLFGMWIFLILTGLTQNHLLSVVYIHPGFMTFLTKFLSMCFCAILLKFRMNRVYHPAPMIIPSVLNVLSYIFQMSALQTIEFPVFALFKSFRILIVSVGMKYNYKIKMLALFISIISGHFLYIYEFNRTQSSAVSLVGICWITLFVFSDSFTSISQEKIFVTYKLKPIMMMYYINMFIVLIYSVDVMYNKLWNVSIINWYVILNIICISFFTSISQFFTMRMIYQFGSFVYVMSATIRTVCFIVFFRLSVQHAFGIYEMLELFTLLVLIYILYYLKDSKWTPDGISQTMNLNPRDLLPVQRLTVTSESNQEEKDGLLAQRSMNT